MDTVGGQGQPPELRFDRITRADGVTCLVVHGEIDVMTGDHFTETIGRVLTETGVGGLRLDFEPLRFIDSNGVTALVKAQRTAQQRGVSLGIVNVPDSTRHVLEVLGVYEMLAAEDQRE
jgi:anti-anti-sigma factor